MTSPGSRSLFDDAPDAALAVTPALAERRPSNPAEQAFHRLVARIEAIRAELTHWQTFAARFNQRLAGELVPLRAKLLDSQRAMARGIDELLGGTAGGARLGRGERKKLRHLLLRLVSTVLEEVEDPELEALHDRYSDHSLQELGQSQVELTQAMLKDVFGVDLGEDHGAKRPEELLERAHRVMEERAARAEVAPEPPRGRRGSGGSRARAAKREAVEAERQRAAQEVGQSMRDIYRKLVSALHPDREQDPQVRDRKTALMQRVNHAYEKDDLLSLLRLQLEIEQIDAAHLATVPPQRLAHYNQVLREQLAGLQDELERCIAPFRELLGPAGRGTLTHTLVDRQLTAEIAQLKMTIRSLEADRISFRDPGRRAELLRDYRPDNDEDELNDLEALLDLGFEPQRRRGRRRRR
jgi:hypothetical protein